jgi:RNA polymerase sigma-70 factor (ECF subfamily)
MKEDAAHPVLPANDAANAAFSQTHWTNVLRAKGSSAEAVEALNQLCRRYWPPVYAFIRRKWTQHSAQKAEDLTQEFFVEFIRKFPHLELDASKGKFRTYLLACLNRFLCKDWERSPEARELIIPPEEMAEFAGTEVASAGEPPERSFDVAWANLLVEKALIVLRQEYADGGKAALHDRLLPLLTARSADGAYAVIGGEFGMSEGALRVATHQLRRRFGEILRGEVGNTVGRIEDTDDELRYLLSLWGGREEIAKSG